MRNIPYELTDKIFFYLEDSISTLVRCILVCKLWQEIAYPRRFRRLHVVAMGYTTALQPARLNGEKFTCRSFDVFLEYLRQCDGPRPFVQELVLHGGITPLTYLDLNVVRHISVLIPHLRLLKIAVPLIGLSGDILSGASASFRPMKLDKLTIEGVIQFTGRASITEVLFLVDHVDELELCGVVGCSYAGAQTAADIKPLSISKLTLQRMSSFAAAHWLDVLSAHLQPCSLTSFMCSPVIHMNGKEALTRFIAKHGQNLQGCDQILNTYTISRHSPVRTTELAK